MTAAARIAAAHLDPDRAKHAIFAFAVLFAPIVYVLRKREREWFQRVASPVWLADWDSGPRVTLGFRDPALSGDTAVLSEVEEAPVLGYRASLQASQWQGPRRRPLRWWVGLVVSAVCLACAIDSYVTYTRFEERHARHFPSVGLVTDAVYRVGGKWAIVGIYLFGSVLFAAVALAVRRHGPALRERLAALRGGG